MNNPYQTPESQVRDLTVETTPAPLEKVIKLILIGFGLAVLQIIVYLGLNPAVFADDEFSGEFLWFMLGTMLLVTALIFFLYYYLCLYRPVKKRKRSAAKWLFWANTVMVMISIYSEFALSEPEAAMSMPEMILYTAEVTIIYYAAYLLTRPDYKVHLVN